MNLKFPKFQKNINQKSILITVVGLGKMGLPIAMVFANRGFKVTGYDISEELVSKLNQGKTELKSEPGVEERVSNSVKEGNFSATTDMEKAVENADIIITIIPILDKDTGEQEMTVLKEMYNQMSEICRKNTLFIQESTLSPGTSKHELWPILEKNQDKNKRFGLVFAPERTLSGRAIKDIEENYPKLVGGINKEDGEIAKLLYEQVAQKGVINLRNATTAEAVKTFKGAYRDANIALANQFAIMADHYGVDILEVIEAANTEPYSHIHTPGIGVGGHCIPVYPKFLIYSSKQLGYTPNLLQHSREVNDFMVDYAIKNIKAFDQEIQSILVMGFAYRNNIKEFRHSPTLRLVPLLRNEYQMVKVTDPIFEASEISNILGANTGISYENINYSDYDAFIITTDHDQFKELDPKIFGKKVVFDGRYVLDNEEYPNILQPGRMNIQNKDLKNSQI